MLEYDVEVDEKKRLRTSKLSSANRKAALLSKPDGLAYVVAFEDAKAVGHRIYANGRLLREEGRGF